MKGSEYEFVSDDTVNRTNTKTPVYAKRSQIHAMSGNDVVFLHEACQERLLAWAGDSGKKVIDIPRIQEVDTPSTDFYVDKDKVENIPMWSGEIKDDYDKRNEAREVIQKIKDRISNRLDKHNERIDAAKKEFEKVEKDESEAIQDIKNKCSEAQMEYSRKVSEANSEHNEKLAEIKVKWDKIIQKKESNGDYISQSEDPDEIAKETRRNRDADLASREKEIIAEYGRWTARLNSLRVKFDNDAESFNKSIVKSNDTILKARKKFTRTKNDAESSLKEKEDEDNEEIASIEKSATISPRGSDYVRADRFIARELKVYSASSRRLPWEDRVYEGERVNRACADISNLKRSSISYSTGWPKGRYLEATVGSVYRISTSDMAGGGWEGHRWVPSTNKMQIRLCNRYQVGQIKSIRILAEMVGIAYKDIDRQDSYHAVESRWFSASRKGISAAGTCSKWDAEMDNYSKQVSGINEKYDKKLLDLESDHKAKTDKINADADEREVSARSTYESRCRSNNKSYISEVSELLERYNTTYKIEGKDASQISRSISNALYRLNQLNGEAGRDLDKELSNIKNDRKKSLDDEDKRYREEVYKSNENKNKELGSKGESHSKNLERIKKSYQDECKKKEDEAERVYDSSVSKARQDYRDALKPLEDALSARYEELRAEDLAAGGDGVINPFDDATYAEMYGNYIDTEQVERTLRDSTIERAHAKYLRTIGKIEDFEPDSREIWEFSVPSGPVVHGDVSWETYMGGIKLMVTEWDFGATIDGDFPDYRKIDEEADEEELDRTESGWLLKEDPGMMPL